MRSTDFIDNSNQKARFTENKAKRWCENHPRSYWGETYSQCVEGYKKGEECKEGSNE